MNCSICGKEMIDLLPGTDLEHAPKTLDLTAINCGGDCMQCMADAGDPDCQKMLGVYHEDHP